MTSLLEIGVDIAQAIGPAVRSIAATVRDAHSFDDVEAYCMFVGYPRSGHSLVGGLLDAHPNAVIASELDAVKYFHLGLGRRQVFYLLRENARRFARDGCRKQEFTYSVPGQWQGRHERLRVIGDKKAMGTTMRIRKRPWLLDRLRETVGVPVKMIHIVRNPYDNIATMCWRARQEERRNATPEACADLYFAMCETAVAVLSRFDGRDVLAVRHEEFVRAPADRLSELCGFLGLPAERSYLDACASIVNESPNPSRRRIDWTPALVESVSRRASAFPHLAGYEY
jgi:hypothetical protein